MMFWLVTLGVFACSFRLCWLIAGCRGPVPFRRLDDLALLARCA